MQISCNSQPRLNDMYNIQAYDVLVPLNMLTMYNILRAHNI